MDLRDVGTPNELHIYYSYHGDKEQFPPDLLSDSPSGLMQPRFFSFGTSTVQIATQLTIVRLVTGDDLTLDEETAKRRQKLWKRWYLG